MTNHNRTEQGIVSILTVLFLTVLLTVLTVSFLRIMNDEQEQTINDDLTKSAYASALSGIEDGKRALLYCYSLSGSAKTQCIADLTNPNCPGAIRSGNSLTSGPSPVLRDDGQVGGDPSLNQRYTCLLIDPDTSDYLGQAQENRPRVIELSGATPYNTITLRWHKIGAGDEADGDAYFVDNTKAATNPRSGDLTNGSNQAVGMLRAQVMAFEPSSGSAVTTQNLNDKTATAFFVPRSAGAGSPALTGAVLAPQTGGEWSFRASSRQNVACTTNETTYEGYSCQVKVRFENNGGSMRTLSTAGNNRYYVMIGSMYDNPHYQISLQNSAGNAVKLRGVQPQIDVTGAASDVYRRLRARVDFAPEFVTNNAVQTGGSLCKAFYVTKDAWDTSKSDQPVKPGSACTGLGN